MKGFPVGDPRASAAGRRGGIRSREKSLQKALSECQALWPGMPHAAAVWLLTERRKAYVSGWTAGMRQARRVA